MSRGGSKIGAKVPKFRATLNCIISNFQRLETTTMHAYIRCVKISDKGKVKNRAKVPKYEATLNCNISS